MTCSAASTLQSTSKIPLPAVPGLSAAQNQALKRWGQQVLSQIQGAAGATGVNVVPQQYALLTGSTLPPLSGTSNCTVSIGTGPAVSPAGCYKITITGTPATVTFSADTAWPIHPGWQWIVSFFQQASAAISGSLTITTPTKAYSTNFTTTLSASGWERLFDTLNLGADTSSSYGLSFTFTGGTGQIVYLDGFMLEPYFNVAMAPSPFISTSSALTLDNQPDGPTYARPKGTSLRSGIPADNILRLFPSAVLDADGTTVDVTNTVTLSGLWSQVIQANARFYGDVHAVLTFEIPSSTISSALNIFLWWANGTSGINGYALQIALANGATGGIFRLDNGVPTALSSPAANAAAYTGPQTMEIFYYKTTGDLELYWNGQLYARANDKTYDYGSGSTNWIGVGYSVNDSATGYLHDWSFLPVFTGSPYVRMPTPPAASAAAATTLTQSGTTTAINVGAGTYYLGNLTINANSGSVDPGAYGTYYVYFDNPGYTGGAVTYQATTSKVVPSQSPYRIFVGTIATSSGGGGSGGGTIGCFSGDTRIRTSEGLKRFDELPPIFEILNHTGKHIAELLVHRDWHEPMRYMGKHLVTERHLIKVGNKWIEAKHLFPEPVPVKARNVYNIHVLSDSPDDWHYILENGLTAHNAKP